MSGVDPFSSLFIWWTRFQAVFVLSACMVLPPDRVTMALGILTAGAWGGFEALRVGALALRDLAA